MNMEANVLKNIGSLVKGDILDYDKDKEYFYLDKIEEFKDKDISRNKKICVTLTKWFVEENPEYFEIVDEHGNVIVTERTNDFSDKIHKTEDNVCKEECLTQNQECGECSRNSELEILKKENEELKEKLNNINSPSTSPKQVVILPYRWNWLW